ncbi:MAG TPA: DsrE/DsrF/DrsH-like family protein [Bacteroidales bacterium]|nr:DsrE/DsrF/DrsH-like family protein [Bacteroidales bacterium]HPJ58351.1 DsrE/DsrF/DrsH-like family protein [Bacteroidales bacterium]HPR10843.1 DsrE/DsrF/DrsH-like family protein [Bacteroidales bacterium]HRW84197.1 DsrE/DsrF/DrsH-like family protein [Bacteroidales bacterium]
MEQDNPVKKVNIICAKGAVEDVYATLVMGNGAVMEGITTNLFFTFFGLDAIVKSRMDKLHTAVVGNPALRLPGGMRMPTLLGIIPGMEAFTSRMMKGEMEKLDIPPVSEFLDLITAGGGKIYACKLAMDMFKFKKEDLSEHVSGILTVGEFYEHAGGVGSHIIFT